MVRLGAVVDVNPKAERLAPHEEVSFVGMAQLDAMTATALPLETRPYGEVSKGYTQFRDNDVLAAKITPCWENGKIGVARLSRPVGVGSTEFHVLRAKSELDARFLLHFLRQESVRLSGELRMTGSAGQRRVPASFFSEMSVPLPSAPEQRRIAAILDHADAVRAKRRQVLAHLDSLPRAVFLKMFGDPVSNSRGLPMVSLRCLGTLDRGVSRHRPRNDPRLLGGPYPLVQTGDVANSGGRITEFSSTYSELGLKQSRIWPVGTLCITIAANIAKTGILTFEACFPDSVVGFSAMPHMTSYVQTWLSFLQPTLEAQAPQSAQRNINLRVLHGLQIPRPSDREIQMFATSNDRIRAAREQVSAALALDDELFASLQARAFRGEL